MKILIWMPAGFLPAIGGIESFTYTLATGLIRKGHEVMVLAFQPEPEYLAYENHLGIDIYRFSAVGRLDSKAQLLMGKQIHRLLKTLSPDVLHLQYTPNANLLFYFLLVHKIDVPIILTHHGFLNNEYEDLNKRIEKSAQKVVYVSHYLSKNSAFSSRPCVIQNAVLITEDLFIPPHFTPPKFLCLGRFTMEKGYDLAIHAFSLLSQSYPAATLLLAGEGVEKRKLMELSHSLGIAPQVQFLPALSHQECLSLLKEISAVLIPSRYESFGLVALEAGMLGRPVIASQTGGLSEIIVNGTTGILVESENIHAFYFAMKYLVDHPQQAVEMGEAAYAHIRKNFCSKKMISQYEILYQTVRSEYIEKPQKELLA